MRRFFASSNAYVHLLLDTALLLAMFRASVTMDIDLLT